MSEPDLDLIETLPENAGDGEHNGGDREPSHKRTQPTLDSGVVSGGGLPAGHEPVDPNVTIRRHGNQHFSQRRSNQFEYRPSSRHSIHPTMEDLQFGGQQFYDPDNATELQPMKPAALLHTIQKWQLHFSGARGEDVENYISLVSKRVANF